jgi:hypothetical protein
MKTQRLACVLFVALGLTGLAGANLITVDGTLHTPSSWDLSRSTIDVITFTVTAGTTVNFDIAALEHNSSGVLYDLNGDSEYTGFEGMLTLFDTSGEFAGHTLATDVGSWGAPPPGDNSVNGLDPYLTYTFESAGTYQIAFGSRQPLSWAHGYGYTEQEVEAGWWAGSLWQVSPPTGQSDHADWLMDITFTGGQVNNVLLNEMPIDPAVPEPASIVLVGIGLAGLALGRFRRQN